MPTCRAADDTPQAATEQARRPLAPARVQEALAGLASRLADQVVPDHVKVVETANAVVSRLAQGLRGRPVLVFAERTETLKALKGELEQRLPVAKIEILDGTTSPKDRDAIVGGFKGDPGRAPVHVVLASQVAEMGLDIDGPVSKDDIWLIHHDYPWNPGMVDQRNGRVSRTAKGVPNQPVYITYPFIRDTVDERIFKRMLMRQAIAELLLGTDEVARALRLTDQDTLDDLSLERIAPVDLRNLTPNLAPDGTDTPPAFEAVAASATASPQSRPGWCPIELVELADARTSGTAPDSRLADEIQRLADALAVEAWPWETGVFLRVDLQGRKQAVAVLPRDGFVEALSLADTTVDDARVLSALSANAQPGVAGLMLVADRNGEERLVARAANLLDTLDESELQRIVCETARRADNWEAEFYGGEDRW